VTLREEILVPFAGSGAGTGELSWGQRAMWQSMVADGHSITVGGVTELAPGSTVAQAVDALQYSVSRHQALRTKLRFGADGTVRQEVFEAGQVRFQVVDAADQAPAAVAHQLLLEFQNDDFDYEHEWPIRSAVVRAGDTLTHAVAVYLHTALDAHGLNALLIDLLSRDPATGASRSLETGATPLEQAHWQQTPAARRQCVASLRHMERVLRAAPAQRFAGPIEGVAADYPELRFRSPAIRLAVQLIAHRLSMDTSQVLLALFAIGVSRMAGLSLFAGMIAVNNRFRRGFDTSVSPLAQVSPFLIDLAGLSYEEAIGRARQAAMSAYKYAYYDPAQRLELVAAVNADRGELVDMSCFFNDRRELRDVDEAELPTEQQLRAAVGRAEHVWDHEAEQIHERLYFSVNDDPDAAFFTLSGDVRYLPMASLEAFVYDLEAIAVQAVLEPHAGTGVHTEQRAS
jgi:hypothetical protein